MLHMSQDALKSAVKTEDPARQAVENARIAGEKSLAEAIKNAEKESAEMLKQAEHEAAKQALDLASNTENKKAAMLVRAEREMEQASAFIVEKVLHQAKAEG